MMQYIIQEILIYMNKSDIKLILIILIFSFLLLLFTSKDNSNYAFVYYDNKEVLRIDLSINENYTVEGFNGEVLIEVKDNKLRVIKEESPLHICSKQGFMNSGSIVCLPNKIVITFSNDDLDTVVS